MHEVRCGLLSVREQGRLESKRITALYGVAQQLPEADVTSPRLSLDRAPALFCMREFPESEVTSVSPAAPVS
jgi:hypothetical protein